MLLNMLVDIGINGIYRLLYEVASHVLRRFILDESEDAAGPPLQI